MQEELQPCRASMPAEGRSRAGRTAHARARPNIGLRGSRRDPALLTLYSMRHHPSLALAFSAGVITIQPVHAGRRRHAADVLDAMRVGRNAAELSCCRRRARRACSSTSLAATPVTAQDCGGGSCAERARPEACTQTGTNENADDTADEVLPHGHPRLRMTIGKAGPRRLLAETVRKIVPTL